MEPNHVQVSEWRMSDGKLVTIEQHPSLTDTADLAREYARLGYPDRYAVFARTRTVPGKFFRKTENGLFLSLILRPSLFAKQAKLLRMLSGLALLETLEGRSSEKLNIGWQSKILCRGKEIGETSVECRYDGDLAVEYLIVTFRVRLDPKRFSLTTTDLVGLVFREKDVSLSSLLAKLLLERFFRLYPNLKSPKSFMDIYRDKFVGRGCRVICRMKNGEIRHLRILSVNSNDGTLVCQDSDGVNHDFTSQSQVTFPKRIRRNRF